MGLFDKFLKRSQRDNGHDEPESADTPTDLSDVLDESIAEEQAREPDGFVYWDSVDEPIPVFQEDDETFDEACDRVIHELDFAGVPAEEVERILRDNKLPSDEE